MISDRLAITITHADGSQNRWGPDEPDGHDIPDDLSFTTSIPGGFKDCSCTLTRGLEVFADEALFDDMLVYGPGGEVAWEGRLASFPRDVQKVTPTAVGWAAHLTDSTTAREIYADADLTQWHEASATRENAAPSNGSFDVTPGMGGEEWLRTRLSNVWEGIGRIQPWYGQTGIPLGAIIYNWWHGTSISDVDTNWAWKAFLSDDGVASTYDATASLRTGPSSGNGTLSATTTSRKFGILELSYAIGAGTDGNNYDLSWQTTVLGTHSLTWSNGFLPSDIITNVLQRWAPLLTYTPNSIEPSTFRTPHFVQYTATTPEAIITAANAYELKDWGVYRGGEDGYPPRTFFLREPSPDRLTWRARISDGAVLTDAGIQSEEIVNGVVVNYTTYDGTSHTVGPPGSGLENEDAALYDADPTNPVTAHGIPAKYGQLDMTAKASLAVATQIGAIWLSRRVGIQHRGTLSATGQIKHPSGVYYPVWRVRAGDYVIVEDDPRSTEPRKIVGTNYSHASRTVHCDLEHDPFRLDALMLQIGTIGV